MSQAATAGALDGLLDDVAQGLIPAGVLADFLGESGESEAGQRVRDLSLVRGVAGAMAAVGRAPCPVCLPPLDGRACLCCGSRRHVPGAWAGRPFHWVMSLVADAIRGRRAVRLPVPAGLGILARADAGRLAAIDLGLAGPPDEREDGRVIYESRRLTRRKADRHGLPASFAVAGVYLYDDAGRLVTVRWHDFGIYGPRQAWRWTYSLNFSG